MDRTGHNVNPVLLGVNPELRNGGTGFAPSRGRMIHRSCSNRGLVLLVCGRWSCWICSDEGGGFLSLKVMDNPHVQAESGLAQVGDGFNIHEQNRICSPQKPDLLKQGADLLTPKTGFAHLKNRICSVEADLLH